MRYDDYSKLVDDVLEAEGLYKEFFFHDDMLNVIISSDGIFKYVSEMWCKVSGYTKRELTSKPCFDFIHHDDIQRSVEAWGERETDDTGVPPGTHFKNRYRKKDGGWFWVKWYNPKKDESNQYWLCPAVIDYGGV